MPPFEETLILHIYVFYHILKYGFSFSYLKEQAAELTDKHRWKACQAVARDYPALGYLHTHQKIVLGGKFAPHIHLIVALPSSRVERWKAGAKADLVRRFAPTVFTLSDPDSWVLNPDDPVAMLKYVSGHERHHLPTFVYWTNSKFAQEQQSLNTLLSQAIKQQARLPRCHS
ncbi:MAG: hypothetical protein ACJAVM_002347 [Sulfitobacter sp.]|jgi:hypothetical protein